MLNLPKVKHLIYFDSRKRAQVSSFPSSVCVHSMSELEALGAKHESRKGSCWFILVSVYVIKNGAFETREMM